MVIFVKVIEQPIWYSFAFGRPHGQKKLKDLDKLLRKNSQLPKKEKETVEISNKAKDSEYIDIMRG